MNNKIFIATPAYSGKVHAQFAVSLADTGAFLQANGFHPMMHITTSGSLIVAERNRILERFWQSPCDRLLCIDGDLGWPADVVLKLIQYNKEFVGGVYPARKIKGFTFRTLHNEDNSIVSEGPLIKMEYIPAGFMLITRSAIQKMRDKFPELYYSPKDPRSDTESTYCLFNTEVWNGEFWGEDYVFCRRARQAGVDIWVDPFIQFDHDGNIGSLSEILTNKPPHLELVKPRTISEAA